MGAGSYIGWEIRVRVRLSQGCTGIAQVITIVQQEQHMPGLNKLQQRFEQSLVQRLMDAQRLGYKVRYQRRLQNSNSKQLSAQDVGSGAAGSRLTNK